ncbi:MAG: DNA cytosine methyltransferase [Spiroplasma sp.]
MLKVLELFGGIGAPRQALENLGVKYKIIDYVKWWPWAVKAYNQMFDNNYKPEDVKDWNLNIDLLFHGSPCQDWSNAGGRDLTKGRSLLYLRTLEIIEKELHPKPKYIVWENVPGLISKKFKPYFQYYLNKLTEFGYTNYWKVLNAKDFGLPQSRNRVFVVSIRNDIKQEFNFENLKTKPMKPLLEFIDI